MGALLLIFLGFDLGWRGYGWRSHLVVAGVIIMLTTTLSLFGGLRLLPAMLFGSTMMSVTFEIMYVLPSWGAGLAARRIFGGGKAYSLNFSFEN